MKYLLTYLVLFLLTTAATMAQDWVWGLKATGNHQYSGGGDIAVTNQGEAVFAGYYQETFILDGHSLFNPHYDPDIYLGRLNKDGHVAWLISIEADRTNSGDIALTTDDNKNIYLTGSRDGYIFVSKYDSTGLLMWNNNFQRKYYGFGKNIAIDQFDNVYVVGGGGWDFFLAKLDYYGQTIWLKDNWVNFSAGFNVNDIAVDGPGNAYFAGHFGIDSIQLDDIQIKQKGSAFWGKIDPNGKFIWARAAKGSAGDYTQLALTPDDQIYLSGSFDGHLTIDNTLLNGYCCSDPRTYLAKYDSQGNFIWAKAMAGMDYPSDMISDYNGNIYLAGNNFDCFGTQCTEYDYYLEKYDASASLLWRKDFKNWSYDLSKSIDLDNNGSLYVTSKTQAEDAINDRSNSAINTLGIGKLNTLSTTTKRTSKPTINRVIYNCNPAVVMSLQAKGENVRWYDSPDLSYLVHTGQGYEQQFQVTDTLYVTQTVNNIESWPQQVIVYRVDLSHETLKYNKDTLSVSPNPYLSFKWSFNGTVIPHSNSHFWVPKVNGKYSVEIQAGNCSKTLDYSYERPTRPQTDSIKYICYKELLGPLSVQGENIIWYNDPTYNDTLFVGNPFDSHIQNDKTFYVRQTVNGIASEAQKVIIKFSQLKDSVTRYGPDRLYVTYDERFKYQWYYQDALIPDAHTSTYFLSKNGLYKVIIADGSCTRSISHYFVASPKISNTIYYLCANEPMPTLTAEGNNLLWISYDNEKQRVDTLSKSNSCIPLYNRSHYVYLTQSENGHSSYPIYINILVANFSKMKISTSDQMVGFEGKDDYLYRFQWYLNDEPNPVYWQSRVYYPYTGKYKIKVSLGDRCDTTFNFSYYPKYDSLYYMCNNVDPLLKAYPYNTVWFSDANLKNAISYNSEIYPRLNGKDSTFYVAQFLNQKPIWKGQVKVFYPHLEKLQIVPNDTALMVNLPRSYFNYQWQYEGIPLDNRGFYCKPDKEGTYSVNIQAGDCTTNLNYSYRLSTVNPLENECIYLIYPNPARETLHIESNSNIDQAIQIKLYAPDGRLIFSKRYDHSNIAVDSRALTPGIYLLEIIDKTGASVYKVTKW